jgi:hypothetical protein
MNRRKLHPCHPKVVKEVIQAIRATTREEWIEELSKYPDWDPSWLNRNGAESMSSPNGGDKGPQKEAAPHSVARS